MKEVEGGKYSIKTLVEMGCRKFGAIFKSDDRQGLLRYAGFCEGLLDSGLGLDSAIVRWYTTEDKEDGTRIFSNGMVEDYSNVDGLVCYNDQVAMAAINSFRDSDVPMPKIISFDHSHLSDIFPKSIISIGHRKEELGITAATKMINMLEGKKEESLFLDWII